MAAFFPPPDLLLQDGAVHLQNKSRWKASLASVVAESIPLIREVTLEAFSDHSSTFPRNFPFDLYEALKNLAWDLLIGIFLGLSRERDSGDFVKIEGLQEDLLRGQFSLIPVPLKVPFWASARSRGLKAVKSLEPAIRKQLRRQWATLAKPDENRPQCPFAYGSAAGTGELGEDEIVSHVRLFTSSIANKALASLLTAYFLNIFVWRDERASQNQSLASLVRSQPEPEARTTMLRSVLYETARLSPPVIGVMRRAMQTVHLEPQPAPVDTENHAIPAGNDAWLYVAAANRDSSVFTNAKDFRWDRYMSVDGSEGQGLAFGAGAKHCLGAELMYQICETVMQTVLDSGLSFEGKLEYAGVREWLGWQRNAGPGAMARDLKQLPCQRPRRPVTVVLRQL